jgi:acyl carrier protein phosphodiesterase
LNFLAHCALASTARFPEDEALIVGGFLGDFHKGVVSQDLPADIQTGIRLHRRIDAFSNQQEDIKNSIRQFSAPFRRLAPVFVDILADHYLATAWSTHYTKIDLLEFCQRTYQQINKHSHLLPESGKVFFTYMKKNNLLAQYRSKATPIRAMVHTAKRIGLEVDAQALSQEIEQIDDQLRKDFRTYYPLLEEHCRTWVTQNTN